MMKFGNLVIAGIVTGSIYAVFAVCVAVWYRVSNILNLAVGDFAMVGALGVDYLFRVSSTWTSTRWASCGTAPPPATRTSPRCSPPWRSSIRTARPPCSWDKPHRPRAGRPFPPGRPARACARQRMTLLLTAEAKDHT